MAPRWLNIGSSSLEGRVNLDGFDDDTLDYVFASHVFQHIRAPADLVIDIHRILRTGGILEVFVPYGVVQSPYLRAFFPNTMDSFVKPRSMLSRSDFQLPSKPLFKKLKQETPRFLWKRKEIHWILEKR